MSDLRIGAVILKEAIDLETEKQERATKAKKEEKAVVEAAANKVRSVYPITLLPNILESGEASFYGRQKVKVATR